jgi:hypothetical protein
MRETSYIVTFKFNSDGKEQQKINKSYNKLILFKNPPNNAFKFLKYLLEIRTCVYSIVSH